MLKYYNIKNWQKQNKINSDLFFNSIIQQSVKIIFMSNNANNQLVATQIGKRVNQKLLFFDLFKKLAPEQFRISNVVIRKNPKDFLTKGNQILAACVRYVPAVLDHGQKQNTKYLQIKHYNVLPNPSPGQVNWLRIFPKKNAIYVSPQFHQQLRARNMDDIQVNQMLVNAAHFVSTIGFQGYIQFQKLLTFYMAPFISPIDFCSLIVYCSLVWGKQLQAIRMQPIKNTKIFYQRMLISDSVIKQQQSCYLYKIGDFTCISPAFTQYAVGNSINLNQMGAKIEQIFRKKITHIQQSYYKSVVMQKRLAALNATLKDYKQTMWQLVDDTPVQILKKAQSIAKKAKYKNLIGNDSQIRQQQTQNINPDVLKAHQKHVEKFKQFTTSQQQIAKQLQNIKVQYQLDQQVSLQLTTTQSFFKEQLVNLMNLNYQINVNQMNKYPQQISTSILILNNKSKMLKIMLHQNLLQNLTKIKLQKASNSTQVATVQKMFQFNQKQYLAKLSQFVAIPTQQIQVLKLKGQRILQQNKKLTNVQQKMKNVADAIYGQNCKTVAIIQSSTQQTKMCMNSIWEALKGNQQSFLSLTSNMQKALSIGYTQLSNNLKNSNQVALQQFEMTLGRLHGTLGIQISQIKNSMGIVINSLGMIVQKIQFIGRQISRIGQLTIYIKQKADVTFQNTQKIIDILQQISLNSNNGSMNKQQIQQFIEFQRSNNQQYTLALQKQNAVYQKNNVNLDYSSKSIESVYGNLKSLNENVQAFNQDYVGKTQSLKSMYDVASNELKQKISTKNKQMVQMLSGVDTSKQEIQQSLKQISQSSGKATQQVKKVIGTINSLKGKFDQGALFDFKYLEKLIEQNKQIIQSLHPVRDKDAISGLQSKNQDALKLLQAGKFMIHFLYQTYQSQAQFLSAFAQDLQKTTKIPKQVMQNIVGQIKQRYVNAINSISPHLAKQKISISQYGIQQPAIKQEFFQWWQKTSKRIKIA